MLLVGSTEVMVDSGRLDVGEGVDVVECEIWLAQCVKVLLLSAAWTLSAFSLVYTL